MAAKTAGQASSSATLFLATNVHRAPRTESPVPRLKSLADAEPLCETLDATALHVVSLNLGGRNTNPMEFEFKGDSSEIAAEAAALLRKAGKAIKDAKEGPSLMPTSEMEVVQEILEQIFKESLTEERPKWRSHIQDLLRRETWTQVLASVRETIPHLFNALNLYTLKLNRPSVWENPASCKEFTNTKDYLIAWKEWYNRLDRASQFWLEDAPRAANKRGLDVPTCFAGLLLFDAMCLCAARCAIPSADWEDDVDGIAEDSRDVPFKAISKLAAKLPASSLPLRHASALKMADTAHALLTQEALSLVDNPTVAQHFLPPFCAFDGLTAIFLRRGSFKKSTDISTAVRNRMEELMYVDALENSQRAWRATARRLAAVFCECNSQLGGFRICFVSLHASKSPYTVHFIEKLRDVLADYGADINAVGVDANCAASEVSAFQKRLRHAGFDIGCTPKQQQVTVAKQRTAFQTQTHKVGEVDISHKDYILTWCSSRVRRGRTTYTPDLRSSYGVEQETKQCVRLPTTQWPFDHCGVATSFQRRFTFNGSMGCKRRCRQASVPVLLMLFILVSPFASVDRESPYGQPGLWYQDGFVATPRFGICEATAPCPEKWVQEGGSCYKTTPRLGYPDVQRVCESSGGALVTIGSEVENQLMLRSLCPEGDFCYIGLVGDLTGTSSWVSGETLNYTRLVQTTGPFVPLWENSKGTDYTVTLLSNMPGDAAGCDFRYPFTFLSVSGPAAIVDVVRECVVPALAMIWSGVLLSHQRPRQQRLASFLLLVAFCVNCQWAATKVLNACFVSNFDVHWFVWLVGNLAAAGGHMVTSTGGLWMIVRRMCVLYPSALFKRLFWANIANTAAYFCVMLAFVDSTSRFAASWPVLFSMCSALISCLLYVIIAVRAGRRLYRTWNVLYDEATSGRNTDGTTLNEQVRAARLHLLAVPLATLSGAARWGSLVAVTVVFMHPEGNLRIGNSIFVFATFLDSITNDFCAHVFAAMKMDEAVDRTKGVTAEVAERAKHEVEQHRLAVQMLKAAPTSIAQLHQLATLEGGARAALGSQQEASAFLILQSAVRVETARIHRLMHCVRIRAMTMQTRYQFLIDVPALGGVPRQHIPEEFKRGERSETAANNYFNWLYAEANGGQQVLFQQLQDLLTNFNSAAWPSDLGLVPEEFPWRIWAGSSDHGEGMKALQKGEVISPGSNLIHAPARTNCLVRNAVAPCIVLEETSPENVLIHRFGMKSPEEVPRDQLKTCRGCAVFVPGPQKKRQRSLDKIAADYQDSATWPAAASLVDVCRCMLLCDDPYAIAVLVAYLRQNMTVVRVKNRFSEDVLEPHAAEELQEIFYAASSSQSESAAPETQTSVGPQSNSGYRDISINVAITTPAGVPFVCEIQVTLSNLAILKNADQKLYTVRRMKLPSELARACVFYSDGEVSNMHNV